MPNPGTDLARQRWDKTPARTVTCAHCGHPFSAKSPNALYCTKTCKWRAQNQRRRRLHM